MHKLALAALLFTAGLPAGAAAPPARIIHTNDILGEIEPCGCSINRLGGMARLERLIQLQPGVRLDAGDLFFSSSSIAEPLQAQARTQALALAKALKLTATKVLVPGERDFSMGVSFYQRLVRESGATAIAANLEAREGNSGSWKPLFPASTTLVLRTQAGAPMRIAILGLVGGASSGVNLPPGLRALEPVDVAQRMVPSLKKTSDRVIVLSHQGLDQDRRLAREVPGIDFVIGAHSQSLLEKPVIEESTSIHQASSRNQWVGLIELEQPEKSRLVALGTDLDAPQGPMTRLLERTRLKLQKEAEKARKATDLAAARVERAEANARQTPAKCAECHERQFAFWQKTLQGRRTIDCQQCHLPVPDHPFAVGSTHAPVQQSPARAFTNVACPRDGSSP